MKRRIQVLPEFNLVQAFDEAGTAVLFTEQSFPGMVGEHYDVYKAYKVHMRRKDNKPVIGKELSYDDLKKIYRGIKGFHPRMDFWAMMRSMSPSAETQRLLDLDADIQHRIQ